MAPTVALATGYAYFSLKSFHRNLNTDEMPPDSVWSDQFNKSEIQLNLRGTGWKNLISNCLEKTEISKGNESKSGCCGSFDPNLVMNTRHKMIKEFPKAFPIPRGQIQSEAFKLLREEYHDKLLRHKEAKLIETEIVKLRQILENHRLLIQKKLQETDQKPKAPANRSKLAKFHGRLPTRLESRDVTRKMNAWLGCSVRVVVESKIGRQDVPGKSVEGSTQYLTEDIPDMASRKGSLIEGEPENESWEEGEGGKDEILRRFLGNHAESTEPEFRNDVKDEMKAEKAMEAPGKVNRKRGIGRVLREWKNHAEWKSRKTENKIEGFLSRLREKKIKQEKLVRANSGTRRKTPEKKEKDEQTDEKLKKLMQEVKASQKEAHRKLKEARTSVEIENKFLSRMEERRKERMERRKKFEERKLKMEEEKEIMQRQREEEKKQKEEQEKRKRSEELREKRRAEKEKKEEQKREREKLRVSTGLAVAHHRVYLLRSYGLRPWVRLMRMRQSQQQQAVEFLERRLKERTLRGWFASVREETETKTQRAEAFHEGILKRHCLTTWMEVLQRRLRQTQAAADWYDLKMMETSFEKWRDYTKTEQRRSETQSEMAVAHYQRKVKLKYMQKLRDYPILKRLEEAKESRKWKWRQKVKEILPDYEPVDISESF